MLDLNEAINQMDQVDIYRKFHPTTKENTSQKLMELSPKLATYFDIK